MLDDHTKRHEPSSIYIVDRLVRSHEGFVGPVKAELQRLTDALGLAEKDMK